MYAGCSVVERRRRRGRMMERGAAESHVRAAATSNMDEPRPSCETQYAAKGNIDDLYNSQSSCIHIEAANKVAEQLSSRAIEIRRASRL